MNYHNQKLIEPRDMASSIVAGGGAFRESVILKGKKSIDPDQSTPQSSYTGTPSNGETSEKREKEVDHYGFLYSISEKDKH